MFNHVTELFFWLVQSREVKQLLSSLWKIMTEAKQTVVQEQEQMMNLDWWQRSQCISSKDRISSTSTIYRKQETKQQKDNIHYIKLTNTSGCFQVVPVGFDNDGSVTFN